MKQKLFTFFLALIASVNAIYASDTQVDGIWYNFDNSTKTASVTYRGGISTSYDDEYSGSVIIPKTVTYNSTTYNVTSIGGYAFSGCSSLTSITIPNSVTSIGDYAFRNCTSLTSITIPNSVTSIIDHAFSGCSSLPVENNLRYADTYIVEAVDKTLSTYYIKAGTKWIGSDAFSGCSSLTSITIPNSVTSIGDYAFEECSSLTSLTIPNSVTSIEYMAFSGCSSLTSITIPNSVTSIGSNAFYCCSSLTSIAIPNSVTSIEYMAFYGCSSLTSITIPNSVLSIGNYAFSNCSSLTSITIPNSVTSIGEWAFRGCSSLTSITIPNSVLSIGNSAFYGCSSLTSMVVENGNTTYDSRENCNAIIETATNTLIAGCQNTIIPNSVMGIGDYAFYSCSSLTSITIPNSVTSIGGKAFRNCTSLTFITIPNSVTSIGDNAFDGCSSLTSITIPNSVTSIGDQAFRGCSSLASMVVESGNTTYDSRENCNAVIETATNTLIAGCQNTIIPNSVTSIGDYAFYYCSSLTSITIPNSVTSIGYEAFHGTGIYNNESNWDNGVLYISNCLMDAQNDISGTYTINEGTRLIARSAFSGCSSLTSITIPNSVTSIGDNAFDGCSSLTSITIPNSVTSIGDNAFYGCSSLTSITIPNSVTSIGSNAFYGCNSLVSITWNVKRWENTTTQSPFSGSKKTIKSFTFGENVEHIPAYICYNMTNLTDISIGQNVSSIGKYAFYGVPWEPEGDNGVIYIGNVLFKYKGTMPANTSITVKDNTTQIHENAFLNCIGLTSITIPETVTTIGESAFDGCSSLTSITIPNSVTSIGGSAFRNCTSLTSITIPNSVTSIGSNAFYGCNSLVSITWNVKRWENTTTQSPFSSSEKKITSFTFGDNVEHIPAYICYNMTNLTNISIGQKVSSIGKYAFYGVPWEPKGDDGVIYIGDVLFKYKGTMPANTSITVKDNTTQIHENAFLNCTGLTSITIPETVTTIGESAFDGCSSLISVNLPKGIKSIDYCTFYGCSALNSITLPDSLITIGRSAFNSCSALESITIPSTVKEIGTYAFSSCSNLKNFVMPNSVDNIGNAVFYSCTNLESIVLSKNISALTPLIADDIIYGFFAGCSSLTDIILPDKLHTIGEGTFAFCSSLASIKIPENVTTIGDYAFYECSALNSIQWNAKNCRNWESYDQAPFYSIASQITSFEFGENVLVIPLGICDNMKNISSITIPRSVKTIEESAFYGCSGLSKINIPNHVTTIAARAFQGCSGIDSLWIGDGIKSIPHHTFCNCYSLDFADLNKVESIGEYAFQSSGLKEITIPNSVTNIDKMAFYNCSFLTSVTIPNNAMNLGSDVWKGCSLSSITLTAPNVADFCNGNTNNSLRELNVLCTRKLQINGLETKTIKIPEGVTKLKEYAFYNCLDLNEVSIPYSLQTISENAFAGCTKLYDVYCYGMEPPMAEQSSFANYNAFLHVPCDNQRIYLLDVVFGNFKYIECIEAETATTDTVVVDPSFNDAEFTWPSNSDADSYTLAISKEGEVFCTLTFNANGQLTGIAFAPSRNGQHNAPAAVQTANGFTFTVTGLDEGSIYTYDLVIKDSEDNTLQSYSGEFRTRSVDDRIIMVEYDATQGEVIGAGTYLLGDIATLTVIPNEGYQFTTWGDGCTDNPRALMVTQDTTLTAIFEILTYNVTVTCDPIHGSVTGSGTYNHGDVATLTAIPNEGYQFVAWGDGNTDNPRTLVVTQDTTLTALFEVLTYNVTVTCDPIHGSVTGSGTYNHGDVATLTAIPNEGYQFVTWGDGNTDNPRTLVVTQDTTLTALFEALTYNVTVTCNPEYGIVSGGGVYQAGETATLTATPKDGYEFVRWSDDNTTNPRTLTVTKDLTLTAEFAVIEDNNLSLISVRDGTLSDWDDLPEEYLFETQCAEGSSWNALKSVKVYADSTYINLVVEWDSEIVTDLSSVPFQVYLNVDNDAPTGGFSDLWIKPNIDLLLEGNFYLDGFPCAYQPVVALYAGTPLANEWAWDLISIESVAANQLITKGVMEIQIDYGKLPVKLENTFTVGFSIQQSWTPVGVLPNAAADEAGNMILAEKMLIRINNVNTPASIENTHSPSPITNCQKIIYNGQLLIIRDGKTYNAIGQEM